MSAIFLETIRDQRAIVTIGKWEYDLIFSHEIGHSGRDDMTHAKTGIMNASGKKADFYDDDTIFQFRKEKNW